MIQILLFYKNPILHTTLSLFLAFILVFFKIPILFLYAIHTYIHPDSLGQSSNGVRAAAASGLDGYQNLSSKTGAEIKKRNKAKEKVDFDENNAQIFRLKLDEGHLQSRLYCDQYCVAFTISFIALSCLLLHNYLNVSESSVGVWADGVFVPILVAILGLAMWFMLLWKITFERSASRRSEKQLSVVFGVVGVFLGLYIFSGGASLVLDFNFVSVDGFGRLFIASLSGCLAGFLFMPSAKSARSFWIGTDQLGCNLSMITCGWFSRMVLYVNQILIIFASLLWINPLAEIFVNSNYNNSKTASSVSSKFGAAEKLVGNVGLLQSDFSKFRLWCLLVSSLLQIVALRPSLQMYLNEALLSWYQRLHASKVPDLDYSRAKVFLHNHYLCLVALQFLAPPVLVLIFLGLSQIDGHSFKSFPLLCSMLPCSPFVKEVALFMAWWVTFLRAIFSSVFLVLHRHCFLYVS
ncbi:putative transmembrane protein 161AB [Senna tora]|uniref:Putative transmembrane protein 161AB n=1 Tax=Senna tora TaxID=362788 RepID=A0A834T038_9FABA|nr:putative transmembrane protein 161AB [Senna tora]